MRDMECNGKSLLMIVNPCAGRKKGLHALARLHKYFESVGFSVTDYVTTERGDGCRVASEAKDFDLIVCIGGDGTLNEVLSGLRASGLDIPLGYIPTGSTNDFARSIGIPRRPMRAARAIAEGEAARIDVGLCDGRYFSYIASFGDVVRSSYSMPQRLKNLIGHAAYFFGGIADLATMKSYHIRLETEERIIEDDFIFGAVSNSTSVAGLLRIDRSLVNFSDGIFEVMLIRRPRSAKQLARLLRAIASHKFDKSDSIEFFHASELSVTASADMPWSLDGERAVGQETVRIVCRPLEISIIGAKYAASLNGDDKLSKENRHGD